MGALPRVCVIGAGASGITSAKALHEAGIPFDVFEKGDVVGGLWVYGNSNGLSSAYRSLHIDTSRQWMQFSDYPMPATVPDFPHHSHIARYFSDYVDHFGFRERITFNTTVEHGERATDGTWRVTLDSGATRTYDAVMVCNGHHWDPRGPEPPFPGTFDGLQMHSHDYRDNGDMVQRNVVVLGMGNSAVDIACEASHVADRTYLAARRGAHVIRKYIGGKPLDQLGVSQLIPKPIADRLMRTFKVRQAVMERTLRQQVGRVEDYGLPKPDHRIFEAHPTVSSELLWRVGNGEITPKPNIAELMGDRVRFVDGSVEKVDVIVYCTGYRITFPFFDEDFISAPGNDLPLFRRVFKPDVRGVFFIGLLQPIGPIFPLAEMQATWVADYLRGRYALPGEEQMRADIAAYREAMGKRFVRSKRHTMEIDFEDYAYQLGVERKRGRRRAEERGFALPIPPRADPDAVVGAPVKVSAPLG